MADTCVGTVPSSQTMYYDASKVASKCSGHAIYPDLSVNINDNDGEQGAVPTAVT
jgi:hypothetical protein